MQLKKQFGLDFVHVMLSLNISDKGMSYSADAATRLFLVMWGFSLDEVGEVFNEHHELGNENRLGDLRAAFERLVGYIKDDNSEVEKYIIQATAMAYLGMREMKDRPVFLEILKHSFNVESSAFEIIADQGANVATCLNYFGAAFSRDKVS